MAHRSKLWAGVGAVFFMAVIAVLVGFLPSYVPLKEELDDAKNLATYNSSVMYEDGDVVIKGYCRVGDTTLSCGSSELQPQPGYPVSFEDSVRMENNLLVLNATQSVGDINTFSRLRSDGGVITNGDVVSSGSVSSVHAAASSSVQAPYLLAMNDWRVFTEEIVLADKASCLEALRSLVVQTAKPAVTSTFIPGSPSTSSYLIQSDSVSAALPSAHFTNLKNPGNLNAAGNVPIATLRGVDIAQMTAVIVCALQHLADVVDP